MDMGDENNKKSGFSIVLKSLKSLKSREMYQSVSETEDDEDNGMVYGSTPDLGSEMETG